MDTGEPTMTMMTMMTMLAFLTLPLLHAEVEISYTVSDHHIAGQPVIVDIQLFNNGLEPESIPDIGIDRWRVEFTVENAQGTQRIHSTKPDNATEHQRSLTSRQVQEVRFEIPNSAAWIKGTHQLSVETPLTSTTPFEHTIVVHPRAVYDIDWTALSNSIFTDTKEVLWLLNDANKKERHLFQGIQQSQYVTTLTKESPYGSSLHLGPLHHIYWIEKQQLILQSRTTERPGTLHRTSIPWPSFEVMGSAITDATGRFMLPIWVPQGNSENTGSLQLVIVDRAGTLSFRKLYQGSKPHQAIQAINQAGTPLIGFHTDMGAWMMSLTEVGDSTVDRLPPKSIHLLNTTPQNDILDMTFAISDTEGLFIGLLTSQHTNQDKTAVLSSTTTTEKRTTGTTIEQSIQFQFHQYSLQGKAITPSSLVTLSDIPTGIEYVNQTHYMTGSIENHYAVWNTHGELLSMEPHIDSNIPGTWSAEPTELRLWTLQKSSVASHTLN
jgi:hypothetical protein